MLKDLQPQPLPSARHCPSPRLEPCANPSLTSGPSLSPPSPQMKSSGLASLRAQNKGQSLTLTEIQHLQWHWLEKQLECLWGLPSVVTGAQQTPSPPAPNLFHHSLASVFKRTSLLLIQSVLLHPQPGEKVPSVSSLRDNLLVSCSEEGGLYFSE